MNIAYPYAIDRLGQTAAATDDAHLRDLIEQLLFTAPGERVNRRDYGCDLRGLVFAPVNDAQLGIAQQLVQASLQQWLGELIQVRAVTVESDDLSLSITVSYSARPSGPQKQATFTRSV